MRFPSHLYAMVDTSGGHEPIALARQLLDSGAQILQLRLKDCSSRDLLTIATTIAGLCHDRGALFIVNDRADIARLAGADGVHVGQDDLLLAAARTIAGDRMFVGVSTHTVEQARAAEAGGADYIGFGAIYSGGLKNVANAQGLDGLRMVRAAVKLPIVAIGGITETTVPDVLAAGADAVAIITDIVRAADLRAKVLALLALEPYTVSPLTNSLHLSDSGAFASGPFPLSTRLMARADIAMAETLETLKFYYDFKSPFSYLALAPTLALEETHRVRIRFMPYPVDLKSAYGGELEQRTEIHWAKVRYLYADARRFANDRGLVIRGPQKLFDSCLALMSGQYAADHGKIAEYADRVFELFFKRELDIENLDALCPLLAQSGLDSEGFRSYVVNDGPTALVLIEQEAERDNIFGVPTLIVAGEPFWGNDRVVWAAKKLDAMGLRRTPPESVGAQP